MAGTKRGPRRPSRSKRKPPAGRAKTRTTTKARAAGKRARSANRRAAKSRPRPKPRAKAKVVRRQRAKARPPVKVAAKRRILKKSVKRPVAAAPKRVKPTKKPAAPAAPTQPLPPLVRRARPASRPSLDRERRRLPDDDDDLVAAQVESDTHDARLLSSARSGRDELKHLLAQHTEASPALTAGDLDANWGDAYAIGDEAPGGDNPTPDQDVVDDIGKALGVSYGAGEELQGSEKITERDRHRWELDPASSDDWPHEEG